MQGATLHVYNKITQLGQNKAESRTEPSHERLHYWKHKVPPD